MTDGVLFSTTAARRTFAAVRKVEEAEGTVPEDWWPKRHRSAAVALVIGKTTAAWSKGSTATVPIWDGTPLADSGKTVSAMNLFADIETGKWVAMLDGYLIAAEC